jgi:hypothetical protein
MNKNMVITPVTGYMDTVRVVRIVVPSHNGRQDYTMYGVNKLSDEVEFFSDALYVNIDDTLYIDVTKKTAKRIKTGSNFVVYGKPAPDPRIVDYSEYKFDKKEKTN